MNLKLISLALLVLSISQLAVAMEKKVSVSVKPLAFEQVMDAIERGDGLKVVQDFIMAGGNVNQYSKYGTTFLHKACFANKQAIVEKLIENGANVNLPDEEFNGAPLHYAALAGHANIVRLLVENGADINHKDNCKQTALERAASTEVKKILAQEAKRQREIR